MARGKKIDCTMCSMKIVIRKNIGYLMPTILKNALKLIFFTESHAPQSIFIP